MSKDLSKEEKATLYDMFDYLCGKVNWGKACLNSTAVSCMNKLFLELAKQKELLEI